MPPPLVGGVVPTPRATVGRTSAVEGRKVYVRDAWESTTEAERARYNVHTFADFARIKQSVQRTLNRNKA